MNNKYDKNKKVSNRTYVEIKDKSKNIEDGQVNSMNMINKNINLMKNDLKDVLKSQKRIELLEKETNDIKLNIEMMQNTMNKVLKTIEIIHGKLNNLDDVVEINKELLIKLDDNSSNNKLRASNLNEEVLMNLGEYGEKIIRELTLASRHYAINKDKIENYRALEEKHQEELILRKEEYKKQGKLDIVESICKKYENLDKIFELKTIEGGIIQRILMDAGVEVIEEYSKGKMIEITKENRVDLEGKVSFSHDSLGVYKIIKSAYELNGDIKQKAEVEKIEE